MPFRSVAGHSHASVKSRTAGETLKKFTFFFIFYLKKEFIFFFFCDIEDCQCWLPNTSVRAVNSRFVLLFVTHPCRWDIFYIFSSSSAIAKSFSVGYHIVGSVLQLVISCSVLL